MTEQITEGAQSILDGLTMLDEGAKKNYLITALQRQQIDLSELDLNEITSEELAGILNNVFTGNEREHIYSN